HGELIGVVLDGVPAGLPLSEEDFLADLARRKSGAKGTTPRKEDDMPQIVSGVCDGCTTGAPLTVVFKNNNTRSGDYSTFRELPRPGHADFTGSVKHNFFNDIRGGGHFSGRITLCLVAAGVVAKKIISPVSIEASITQIGGVGASQERVEGSFTGNPQWDSIIENAMKEGDSVGGVVECVCNGVPVGLGEPFFDSLESQIAHLAFSIPGVRGVEFGHGFAAAAMLGSQHNDCYINKEGKTLTNGAGGINGGISNGNPIVFRVAIKPTASISKEQTSFNFITEQMECFSIKGRHDACIALRCPVIVEAIAAIALANN
ncbi:MAG: chorismate synthase, partial [Bacteroidales bacterium]|nr:chorismate synthase [Bacteroidales bacterium]